MENKLIEIEDLRIGDEILIACQAHMKYLRVLDTPRISATKVHWSTKAPLHKAVRCSTRQEVIIKNYTGYNGTTYSRTEKEWMITPEDHNLRVSVDLSDRQMWLVKRETI